MSDAPGQSSISLLDSAVRMIPAMRFLHKRQANLGPEEEEISATTEALLVEVPETGVTLGQILGRHNKTGGQVNICTYKWRLEKINIFYDSMP